jgi:hypothetical protein
VWKVSMDMTRVLVENEGIMDATTGFVVCRLLQAAAGKEKHLLAEEIADYRRVMKRPEALAPSNDTLGLGILLWTAHWYAGAEAWAEALAVNCVKSLRTASCFPI